jgi:hypothetical protein
MIPRPRQEEIPIMEFTFDEEQADEGVQVISHVKDPAIGVQGYYFGNESPDSFKVTPEAGESKDEFISRCIPFYLNEGKDQDQAVAICISVADENFEAELSEFKDLEESLLLMAEHLGEAVTDSHREAFSKVDNFENFTSVELASNTYVRYQYTGDIIETSREFCRQMKRLDRLYSREEIDAMSQVVGMYIPRPAGSPVDLFTYKGGANCRHYWVELELENVNGSIRVVSAKRAVGLSGEVNPPAVHLSRMTFSELKSKQYCFLNEEQGIVASPIMIPDILIPRQLTDENGKWNGKDYFYGFFSKETIKKLSEKFMKNLRLNNADVEHRDTDTRDVTLIESWIIEDPVHDKSAIYNFNLPVGTWFGIFKINDEKLKSEYKAGLVKGVSISGFFDTKRVN